MTSEAKDPAEQVRRLNAAIRDHYQRGEFHEAVALNDQVLGIIRDAGGGESPVAAEAWRTQAHLLDRAGRRTEVVAALTQVVAVERAIDEPGSRRLIDALNNLGGYAEDHDALGTSADSFREAATLAEERFGTGHTAYALSVNNLAGLYQRTGDLAEAERLFEDAVKVWSEHDADDRFLARSLDSLGAVHYQRGDLLLAFETFQRAESLWVKINGSVNERATNLNNQAAVLQDLSRTGSGPAAERHAELAEQLRRQVLELYGTPVTVEERRRAAEARDRLGVLHLEMGRLAEAEDEIRKANQELGDILIGGHEGSGIIPSLRNLALLAFVQGNPKDGRELLDRAGRISDRELRDVFEFSSDRQRLALVASRQFLLDVDLSVLLRYFAGDQAVIRSTFDTVLRRKGLATEVLVLQREIVRRGRRPELVSQLEERDSTKRKYAELLLAPVQPDKEAERQQQLDDMARRLAAQEIDLSKSLPGIVEDTGDEHRRIAATMPSDAALIEFVRMRAFDFEAATFAGSPWRAGRYVAFVLTPGPPEVSLVDLGGADEIDKLVNAFRAAITGPISHSVDRASDDHPTPSADSDLVLRSALLNVSRGFPADGVSDYDPTAGTALRRAVLDPLVPHLDGRARLIVAPDSTLALFPFEALTLDDGRFAIDEFAFTYAAVGRDILRRADDQALRNPSKATPPVVIADPDFDLAEQPLLAGEKGAPFRPLPGAREEGLMTAAQLGVDPLLGPTATKKRFGEVASPRVLHLATHGFFFGAPGMVYEYDVIDDSDRLSSPLVNGLERLARLANPSLRSGLGLAGVNAWVHGRSVPVEVGNGIMTAEEVSSLDLTDTHLVVLSACETGLGETQVGEGVFGLRRAFALTGAGSLVMSLWRVSDDATRDLMREFYTRLRGDSTVSEALRDAQIANRMHYPHPRDWAAFVSAGEQRAVAVAPSDP